MNLLRPSGRHTRPLPHPTDVPVMSGRDLRTNRRRVPLLSRILVVAAAALSLAGAFLATRMDFSTATPASATARTTPTIQAGDRLQTVRKQISATQNALAQLPRLSAVLTATGNKQTTIRHLESQLRAHLAKLKATEQLLAKQPSASPASVSSVIAYAKAQLGKPYQWGAAGPDAFDCSGLVQQAWKTVGVMLPRTTGDQAQAGTRTTRAGLQPGDLIFTNDFDHVQLYIGDGQVIQARHTGTVVQISPLPDPQYVNAYVHIA